MQDMRSPPHCSPQRSVHRPNFPHSSCCRRCHKADGQTRSQLQGKGPQIFRNQHSPPAGQERNIVGLPPPFKQGMHCNNFSFPCSTHQLTHLPCQEGKEKASRPPRRLSSRIPSQSKGAGLGKIGRIVFFPCGDKVFLITLPSALALTFY